MLTLNDGRAELWQWDTGRTLAVDADCSQVHFSNKVFGRSIDVDVSDGVAIIPDILLQTDKDLNVWAFVGAAENGYTKISKTFTVNRRNKPADYVFTPTEQTTIDEIAAIAQSVRDDADAGLFNGEPGDNGITPHIGDNGNWYLGAEDTGKPSRGETGPAGPAGPQGPAGAPGKDGAGMDITGATVGQIAKITAVDASGVPTAWSPADMPSGGSSDFVVNVTTDENNNCTLDKTFAQIQGAVQAGKNVYAQLNEFFITRMPLVIYNSNVLLFGATTATYQNLELYALAVTASEAKFVFKSAVTYNSDEEMPQVSMAAAPTADMQIATKKYVDGHAGVPSVTAADNGKFLRVVSGAWAAAEISSANGVSF